jgi:hypothetical protein
MAELVFVTWDGGGNVPPALGLAGELVRRGHHVRFLGHQRQSRGGSVLVPVEPGPGQPRRGSGCRAEGLDVEARNHAQLLSGDSWG